MSKKYIDNTHHLIDILNQIASIEIDVNESVDQNVYLRISEQDKAKFKALMLDLVYITNKINKVYEGVENE